MRENIETADPPLLTRRQFLQATTAAAFTLSQQAHGAITTVSSSESIDVNAFLESFPPAKEIPGIHEITSLITPNATKGLIYLRMMHPNPDQSTMKQEDWAQVERCHVQIFATLKYLIRDPRTRLKKLFIEGLVDGYRPYLPEPREEGETAERHLAREGADYILYGNNEIALLGGENYWTKKRAGKAIGENWPDKNNYIYEPREDALLKIAADSEERIIYTLFGAEHDWENNVTRWNKDHPDLRFSLLTLTPHEVHAYYERLKSPSIVSADS